MAKFCMHCGAKLDEGDKFCQNCGTKVPVSEKKEPVPAEVKEPLDLSNTSQSTISQNSTAAEKPVPAARESVPEQEKQPQPQNETAANEGKTDAADSQTQSLPAAAQTKEVAAAARPGTEDKKDGGEKEQPQGGFCSHCGAPVQPGQLFCAHCGFPLTEQGQNAGPRYAGAKKQNRNFSRSGENSEAVLDQIQQDYLSFEGRLNRKPYFLRGVLLYLLLGVGYLLSVGLTVIVGGPLILLCTVSNISLTIRRCHDVDKTGWFALLLLIPLIGQLLGLYLTFARGTYGDNAYGPDPLQNEQ